MNSSSQPFRSTVSAAAFALILCGCSSLDHYNDYRPTIRDRAAMRASNAASLKELKSDPAKRDHTYVITDRDVYDFENDLKSLLRKKAVSGRVVREISATAQVLAAAAAATLLVVDGGATEAAAVLAGGSAVIPNLQKIFNAGERSQAYTDAVGLLEASEARFQTAIATQDGQVNMERLTLAGARFADEIAATIRLMESTISARIPKIEDMEKAHGVSMNTLKVSNEDVSFQNGAGAATVSVPSGDLVVAADSSNTDVVNATFTGAKVTLTQNHAGTARVTIIGQSGNRADVHVDVALALAVGGNAVASGTDIPGVVGVPLTITSPNSHLLSIVADPLKQLDPNKVTVATAASSVTVTPKVPGAVLIPLRNENGAMRSVTVTTP
jgi:hypothetical protein